VYPDGHTKTLKRIPCSDYHPVRVSKVSTRVQRPSRSRSVGPAALEPGITALGVDPFGEGESSKLVTLQQFVADDAAQGYDIPLPDSPLANSANFGSVWESSTGGAVVWYPSSGIEVAYGGTGFDYTGFPADEIQTINGVRAIVLPADNPESFGFSTVKLPIPSGHAVTLLSNGSVSDLVGVARTMSASNSP
jgi:hypothetical protein